MPKLFVLLAGLSWQLSNLRRAELQLAQPFIMTLLGGGIVFAGLCWTFFFLAPAIVSSLIVVCLMAALVKL